jgi:hypothetical protein
MAARGEAELDDDAPLFATDDFRMFQMKIQPCAKRFVHDWVTCPFSHPGEKAKRRDPRYFVYTGIACPSMKKAGACPRGEKCPYAHNVFEYWLHPTRYRTQLCNDGMGCRRRVCFFAHSLAQLRVPATKPFVPPEVLAALEGPQSNNPAAMATVSEAMKRISDSWQAGSRRADQPLQPQPHESEAAQIEARMLEHLCNGAPAEQVVQQLRAASEDTLATDAGLQARLAGALAAITRSRSADDGQEALIQVLQGMLGSAAQQQHQNQHHHDEQAYDGTSHSNAWDAQQQLLQHAQQAAQLQQLQRAQAQLYAHGNSGSAEWPAGSEELQTNSWRRTTHSLPALRENSVVADSGSSGASSGRPSGDYNQSSSIHPAKLQSLLGSAAASSSASYSSGSRPRTPTAAEEYASWVANGGYDASARRSLQYDARPGPARGNYPRRRSLQVEDWRAAPNPFARVSHQWGHSAGVYAPVPLQGFVTGDQGGPYSNMFEGWQPAGVVSSAQPAAAVQYTAGMVQSTFLQPPAGAPGEMHFPAGWHAQRQQATAPRGSLDSVAPRAGGYPGGRQSIDVQPRPASDVFAQRLSLDANMLRGQGEFWVQNQGARYGGTATARHSDTVNYAGGALGHAPPSTEYVMNVSYGANAALQAQPDGGGDQLGPLPTQAQLRRGSHSPATSGSNPGTPAQQAAAPAEHLTTQLGQLYLHNSPLQHSQA